MSQLLKDLYTEIYGQSDEDTQRGDKMKNLAELAQMLSDIVKRNPPWTARYLNSILRGHKGITVSDELQTALNGLAAQQDKINPLQAMIIKITAFSINGRVQPGSVITGESKRCACGVLFVPYSNLQKYCHKLCPQRPKRKTTKETTR